MSGCSIRVDNTFGPRVASNCRSFDFTILFEQSFFSIAPACALIALAPFRLYALWKHQRLAHCDWLCYLKLVSNISPYHSTLRTNVQIDTDIHLRRIESGPRCDRRGKRRFGDQNYHRNNSSKPGRRHRASTAFLA